MTSVFGQSLPIEKDNPEFTGRGRMIGNVVVVEFPQGLVKSWLPRGLKLVEQDWTREGFYPVAVMLLQQEDVFFGFEKDPTSPHNYDLGGYLETIAWAPFVKIDSEVYPNLDDSIVYSHMFKLFLNSKEGLHFGVDYYGINKFLANMKLNAVGGLLSKTYSYDINSNQGESVVHMTYSKKPLKTLKIRNIDLLLKMTQALSLPYVFKHPQQSEIICANVKWNFIRAMVVSSEFTLELTDNFLPGTGKQVLSSNSVEGLSSLGSFHISIPWSFSGPQTCP